MARGRGTNTEQRDGCQCGLSGQGQVLGSSHRTGQDTEVRTHSYSHLAAEYRSGNKAESLGPGPGPHWFCSQVT